jgi:acetyltransferase-like isoleucine patch superfamily enzyme
MTFYSQAELQDLGFKSVGKDVKLTKKCSLYGNSSIEIGDYSRIDDFCVLSGNISIGRNVHISVQTILISGEYRIDIEDFAGVSFAGILFASSEDFSGEYLTNPTIPKEFANVKGGNIKVEKHALIGARSTLFPNVVIGEGSAIGAHSLVVRSVEPWGIYVGSPARLVSQRSKSLLTLENSYLSK